MILLLFFAFFFTLSVLFVVSTKDGFNQSVTNHVFFIQLDVRYAIDVAKDA